MNHYQGYRPHDCTAIVPRTVVITVATKRNTLATLFQFTFIIKLLQIKLILSYLYLSFLSSLKETKQRKVQKRPELRGRNTNSSNHSMRSALPLRLRRTRYAQTAFRISFLRLRPAIRDSITIQRICIPLKTSSCGMFLSVSEKT